MNEEASILAGTPFSIWKRCLLKSYGLDKGGIIYFEAAYIYKVTLLNYIAYDNDYLDNKIKNYILPGLALYKSFIKAGYSKNKSMLNVERLYKNYYDSFSNIKSLIFSIREIIISKLIELNKKSYIKRNDLDYAYYNFIRSNENTKFLDFIYYDTLERFRYKNLVKMFKKIDEVRWKEMVLQKEF